MLLIFCLCALCFGWVGYENLRESAGLGKREIIHDDYSVTTQSIVNEDGIKQQISVEKDVPFYGVNLKFHTYDKVVFGTVFVDLIAIDGTVIASASEDMSTLLNDTFKRFIFDKKLLSNMKESYTLHIYSAPKTQEDKLALWKSETTKPDFTLVENSASTNGTIALQYITSYVGNFIYTAFFFVSGFLILFLLGMYYLIFIKKASIPKIFALSALGLGLVFCVFTPQRGGPDEYVHIATSYYNASRIIGAPTLDKNGDLLMRKCDAMPLNRTSSYSVFEWKETYDGLFLGTGTTNEFVPVKGRIAEVFPPLYAAQTLGVLVARLLNFGYIPMLIMGRIFNLLLYIALVYLAIKAIPFFKTPLCLISLMPIPLQLAGSFSYDTFVVGLCFLFTALCFKYSYENKTISYKEIAILSALAAIIAPSKTIYIVLVAFCFILPHSKFLSLKMSYVGKGIIVAAALFMWLGYNSSLVTSSLADIRYTAEQSKTAQVEMVNESLTENLSDPIADTSVDTLGDNSAGAFSDVQSPAPEEAPLIDGHIMPNGDSIYQFSFGYMITHIPQTIKLVANSIQDELPLYVQGLVGGVLGEIILSPVVINWLYVFALILILLLSLVQAQGETLRYKGLPKWWGLLIALGACGLAALACITWTPINYPHIFGLQGRYFLPVFPLILLFFTNENIRVKKSIDGILIFAFLSVDILILLDAFTIIALNSN